MPATSETPRHPAAVAAAVTSVLRSVVDGAPLGTVLDMLCQHLEAACDFDVTATFAVDDGLLPPSQASTRGSLRVPVRGAADGVLGVLVLAPTSPRTWTAESVEQAEAFADLAGLALDHARARTGADRARREAEQHAHRLAAALDAVPTPTFELDADGRVTRWNQAAVLATGWVADEVVGRPLTTMGAGWGPIAGRVDDARRGMASTDQVEAVRRDGAALVLEVRLNPLSDDRGPGGAIGTLTDLTDRLAVETATRRSQRMEALGQFAGGIAHDFGNMLAAIAGFADLLDLELPADSSDARHDAVQIRQVAERGRALTERLLDFAHSRPTAPTIVDVGDHAHGLERVLAQSLPDDCELALAVADDVPTVLLGEGHLDQVLMNLVSNAGDAMPDGGTVSVRVAAAGDRVTIEVGDEGTGIPRPLLDRVFEPFFSTKGARGTGLGLSNVYAIVRGAGGHIEASSLLGRGSTFRVELPAHHGASPVTPPPPAAPRVLVVDPEPVSRQVLHTALSEAGFRVLAVSGADELDLADVARTDPVRVVLCPAIAGTPADRGLASTIARVRQLQPSVTLVELGDRDVTSGSPGVLTIPRPYVVDQVVATVRQAVGS